MKREDNMQWNVLLKHSPQFTDQPLIQIIMILDCWSQFG